MVRKFAAEFLGTASLVFFAVGVATLTFGFKADGSSFHRRRRRDGARIRPHVAGAGLRPRTDFGLPRQSGGHPGRTRGRTNLVA